MSRPANIRAEEASNGQISNQLLLSLGISSPSHNSISHANQSARSHIPTLPTMTLQHSSVPSQQPVRSSIDVAAHTGGSANRRSMTRPHSGQEANTAANLNPNLNTCTISSNNEPRTEMARPHKRLRRTTSSVANIAPPDSHQPSYDARRPDNAMDNMEPVMMALLQWTEDQGLKW
jgi:hypothetical protein